MRTTILRLLSVASLFVGLASQVTQAADGVLGVVPNDVAGFAVIRNLGETSRSLGEVAKLVQAPAPDLLSLAKGITGIQKGLDEQGDLAVVLLTTDPKPTHAILVPVTSFDDFIAGLNEKAPASGVVEVQIAGGQKVVGHKGSYAAIASVGDREALEKFVASTTNMSDDASLATWLNENRASVVITSVGAKQFLPKLIAGIETLQAQMRKAGGENGQATADAFGLYINLFKAAQNEVDRLGIGVRIDSSQNVEFLGQAKLVKDGAWSEWAAKSKPATEDLLNGLEAKPFVMAAGGTIHQGTMEKLMKMSVKMMQNNPAYKFTPEQAKKYIDLSTKMMAGVTSMRMLMGVSDPSAGVYGNTSMIMTVDDTKGFVDSYEKALAEMRQLAADVNSPSIPVATCERIKVGDLDTLEVSMTLPKMAAAAVPGGPDPQKMMELIFGADGKMKYYVAVADVHTVATAYTSPEKLKEAIAFYKSKQPGLAADPNVAKVAAKLPKGSQMVAYLSLDGFAKAIRQVMGSVPGANAGMIPEFPEGAPLGFAAKISDASLDGHFLMTADTLRAVGDAVAKSRAAARERRQEQPQ